MTNQGTKEWPELQMSRRSPGDQPNEDHRGPHLGWETETYVPSSAVKKLEEDDRGRLLEIANSIQLAIEDGAAHPDFAARDVRYLRKLAEETP